MYVLNFSFTIQTHSWGNVFCLLFFWGKLKSKLTVFNSKPNFTKKTNENLKVIVSKGSFAIITPVTLYSYRA